MSLQFFTLRRGYVVAYQIADDPTSLARIAGQVRFAARDLERAFEELHDVIVAPLPED